MIQKAIDELSSLDDQQISYILEIIARIKSTSNAINDIRAEKSSEQLFYSDSNLQHILHNIQAANDGNLTAHELIEVE